MTVAQKRLQVKLDLLRQEPYLREVISQRANEAKELIRSSYTRNVVRDNMLRVMHPEAIKAERAAQEQVGARRGRGTSSGGGAGGTR